MSTEEKPVKCLVLDAGPLILNEPSISSLLAKAEQLFATQSVLAEIRDPAARTRVQTTVLPFLTVREPSPASIKVVSDFARRTGDLSVLSGTDLQVIALAYELECEKNGGDWRLRKVPGQKGLNGSPPQKDEETSSIEQLAPEDIQNEEGGRGQDRDATNDTQASENLDSNTVADRTSSDQIETLVQPASNLTLNEKVEATTLSQDTESHMADDTVGKDSDLTASEPPVQATSSLSPLTSSRNSSSKGKEGEDNEVDNVVEGETDHGDEGDSDGEWITPSNVKSRLAADANEPSSSSSKADPVMQVATLTTDFALQNVLLQMNLNLLSSRLQRIRHVRSTVLRCHACFHVHRDTHAASSSSPSSAPRQFCARCGQPALTRVGCSVRADGGGLTLHLKRNFQWNHRGDRYSVPKPVAGSASGKHVKGGGKGGWGNGLILTEDQKEYSRALREHSRSSKASATAMMDQDYLPGLLTGRRDGGGAGAQGKIRVGAGRTVNSKKR